MAKNNNLTDFLISLADKIREKLGVTALINPQDFETKIDEIANSGTAFLEGILQADTNIKEIKNDNITNLRMYALAYLPYLETVEFTALTTLNSYVFEGCSRLKTVNLPKVSTLGASCFYNCKELEEFVATTPVIISISSFKNCIKLKKADFTYLSSAFGSSVFQGCSSLDTLIIRKTTSVVALTNVNVFSGTPIQSGTGYVYVPSTLLSSYKSATNWITFANQLRAIEDYPDITGG